MIAMLLSAALAGKPPIPVETKRVESAIPGDYIEVSMTGDKPGIYISERGSSFFCGTNPADVRMSLIKYADQLDTMIPLIVPGSNYDLGLVKHGITSTEMVGYCNASGVVKDGVGYLTFIHNEACFGSAGCTTDTATIALDADKAKALVDAMRWGAAK